MILENSLKVDTELPTYCVYSASFIFYSNPLFFAGEIGCHHVPRGAGFGFMSWRRGKWYDKKPSLSFRRSYTHTGRFTPNSLQAYQSYKLKALHKVFFIITI